VQLRQLATGAELSYEEIDKERRLRGIPNLLPSRGERLSESTFENLEGVAIFIRHTQINLLIGFPMACQSGTGKEDEMVKRWKEKARHN
jgi:hypothetical protein